MLKCPKCDYPVEAYGSDCYPDKGITIECSNDKCNYELMLSCSIRTNNLIEAIKYIHNNFIKEVTCLVIK